MRSTMSILAFLAASPAFAADIFAQAPVAQAVIYPDGATLTLRAEADLPQGTHRVMVPYPGAAMLEQLPRVSASQGVTIGALGYIRDVFADPRALYTEAQSEAAEAVDTAKAELAGARDALATAKADVEAAEARATFLAQVTSPESATPDDILRLAEIVGQGTAEARKAATQAAAALRPLRKDVEAKAQALAAAEAALARLAPPAEQNDMLTIEVTTAAAGPIALEFTEQIWDAGWGVDYDMNFDREAGQITMDRKIIVMQDSDRAWSGVDLTLSTARPNDAIEPSYVRPDQARLFKPMPLRTMARDDVAGAMAEPVIEPEIVVEAAPMVSAGLKVDGLALSYAYPEPVSIAPGEAVELALDQLTLEATPQIIAAPRWDDTAFLTAQLSNTTGEPILPGTASLSRDGYFVGTTEIALIPAGAEDTLPFGPIEGIRLDTIFKRNAEGDTGIISKSNTRVQTITFSVENLTEETQELRALFPLTYSEQEDLNVDVSVMPQPSEMDVDDRRGVSAWDMTLAPGSTQAVEITVEIDWPEDQNLNWNP